MGVRLFAARVAQDQEQDAEVTKESAKLKIGQRKSPRPKSKKIYHFPQVQAVDDVAHGTA